MPRGVGVEVVGVDLEFDRSDGFERLRFHDGHVVCCRDRRAADVAACRPAHVGRSGLDFAEDGRHKPLLLHLFGQGERVAAPDADRFGPADEGGGVLGPVDRTHADAQFGETRLHLFFVIGVGERDGRVGNEDDFAHPVEKTPYLWQRIAQVFLAGIGRIRDQKQFHKVVVLNVLIKFLC